MGNVVFTSLRNWLMRWLYRTAQIVYRPTPQSREKNSMSADEVFNQKRAKIEAMEYLPEELRHFLLTYCKMTNLEIKDEIKFLRPLAEYYQQQYGDRPDLWMSGLRAHGLWMACSLRDPENPDYIQSAFKLMYSKLSLEQLSDINKENKELLKRYRGIHNTRTAEVKSLLSTIDSTDWGNNFGFMVHFTSVTRDLSDNISNDVKQFFGGLFDQCVESLGERPPCGMAVIAIGSLARCETTSYSDIEYMFLIEEDSKASVDYFRRLAFQSYYFLGMLGESNLPTYSVKELDAIGFVDGCKKGLRIDGLMDKAGNMPTGNDVPGSELIFTLEQLVTRYHDIVLHDQPKGPDKGVPSDFADMITHRIIVWNTGNGGALYKELDERINDTVHTPERRLKSLELLNGDLRAFDFVPNLKSRYISGHQEVKWDLYRYISLLLTGINNVLDIKSSTNWGTIEKLVSQAKCSEEAGVVLSFLLASALFIRVDCYNFHDAQKDEASLFLGEPTSPKYSSPRNLFILMASYLIPIKPFMIDLLEIDTAARFIVMTLRLFRQKSLMMKAINSLSLGEMSPSFQWDIFTAVCVTNYYCHAYDKVISDFTTKYGEEAMFDDVDDFLNKLTRDQFNPLLCSLAASGDLSEKHVKLVKAAAKLHKYYASTLDQLLASCYVNTNPRKALLYAKDSLHKIPNDDLNWQTIVYLSLAPCYLQMKDLHHCEEVLNSAKTCLDEMIKKNMYLDSPQYVTRLDYLGHLAALRLEQENYEGLLKVCEDKLDLAKSRYGPGVIHDGMSGMLDGVGLAYHKLSRFQDSLDYYSRSLNVSYELYGSTSDHRDIAVTLVNISCVKRDMREFEACLDNLTRSYEMMCRLYSNITPTHTFITRCVGHIAECHYAIDDYAKSLQWNKVYYANLTDANFVDKERLAICTCNIGMCLMKLEEYRSAVANFSESLKWYKEINQDENYVHYVIDNYKYIAECHYGMSDYTKALHWFQKACTNLTEANVVDKERLAVCTKYMGLCHKQLEDYKSAIRSFSESWKLCKDLNQDEKTKEKMLDICGSIAHCHYSLSEYRESLRWCNEQRTILTGANVVDKERLAFCIANMGQCHDRLEEYKLAVENGRDSLQLYREINQDGKYDRRVTEICGLLGLYHYKMSDYRESLLWLKQQCANLTGPGVTLEACICNTCMGTCHMKLEDYKSAVECFNESLKLYREINQDGKYDDQIENLIGFIGLSNLQLLGDREGLQSFKSQHQDLTRNDVVDEECQVTQPCFDIAFCHYEMSDYTEAMRWYRKDYKNLTEASFVDEERLAVCAHYMGRCYMKLEDYKSAVECFSENLKLCQKINQDGKFDDEIADLLGLIGSNNLKMLDYREALEWFKRQHQDLTRADVIDKVCQAVCIHNMGRCYKALADYKSAIESFRESVKLYNEVSQDGTYDRHIKEDLKHIEECENKLGLNH